MANISDGFGDVSVEKVGQELKEFLQLVQKDAYYLLFDDPDNIEVDNNGNAEFKFGAGGRWNYEANLRGYLEGGWMNSEKENKAYNKFVRALKKKDGLVSIQYTDSDTSMDWMGTGRFDMYVDEEKTVQFEHDFEEENVTLERYAEINGESTHWALEYIYGDEVAAKYDKYVKKVKKQGKEVAEPEVWFSEIHKEEE